MEELFVKKPIPQAYFQLALPVVFGMLASMVYNLADTFFVAQTQNTDLVAGVALCTPLFSFMLAVGDIFGLGGSALMSRLLGQKNTTTSRRVSSFSAYAGIVTGLVVTILLLVFETPILHLFGATSATYGYAARFYRIMAWGAIFIIFSLIPSNMIRTEGLAKQSMIATIAGTALTIILDPIFIFPLHGGAAGAALATVTGYALTDLILVHFVLKRCQVNSVNWHEVKIGGPLIRGILVIGIPASITNLMQSFGVALLNNYLAHYGTTQIAAIGIANKIYMVVMLLIVGFAFGVQPLIGYNFGAKAFPRLKKIIYFDLFVEMGLALVLASLLMIFAPTLVSWFMPQAAIVNAGSLLLRSLLSTTPFIGAILVFTTLFQSTGQALGAFIMAISRQGVVFVIVIVLANQLFGYLGVVWAQPIADLLTFVIGLAFYVFKFRPLITR
ncbi:MATE family efflux transporter [Lactobacillus coryniformis subsp. coryniformis KCTC 3167 = DSM] [Lactiplantibacillus mudanjiangensis]|uniref:MATE family efflux transporter n=1 Tax=Lactiplantibacillus mudanjiangensis TaxID=1296538 RepID=UPI001014901F|nr:MATE family efflux transporter [Lactobacillus coryniformis subsp. coryniformis KCTC 3167 = DSM] [Lactiplantibacillus mudanjiangensis]